MSASVALAWASVMPQLLPYAIIDRLTVDPVWTGAPLILLENQNAAMPQTPNGTVIFAYWNMSKQNNAGSIAITSGGGPPSFRQVPALQNQPYVWMNNWHSNNLSVTNISPNQDTPIQIQAIGPGIPGTSPLPLPMGGDGQQLGYGQTAIGSASPSYMQLVITSNSSTTSIVGIIGGPPDTQGNNGYVIAVNYSRDTGPGTGTAPPEGYYATTASNSYVMTLNWNSAVVFAANLSSMNATPVQIILRQL
ncbi:hypothetical protein [uncultured Sphingomonas sp.]|uniref:hypothetical protein n=1 Tax=uncultured Sphingomonas sp. TaxID=158754 RepID=UPI0025F3569F|nr:hypothetical protein [uncultured Sphingomonas sp.]